MTAGLITDRRVYHELEILSCSARARPTDEEIAAGMKPLLT
jgi:hypothetical protein